MHDFHSLILAVFSSDIRFVVSLEWIIFAPRLIAGELIVNCRNATFYGFCYILKAIFLFSLNCYFVALAFGKMRELFSFFFILPFYQIFGFKCEIAFGQPNKGREVCYGI